MKKAFFYCCFLLLLHSASAQSVAGYWYGTANVENGAGNNFLVELIVKQNSTAVEGILNYYFKNSFRSLRVKGNYNSLSREFNLYNIPLPYPGSQGNLQVDCMMDFSGIHRIAQAESKLNGKFLAREGYRYTCPAIVFDLKLNKDAGNQDSVLNALRNFKESYQLWTPTAVDTLVAATVQQRTIQNPVVNREFKERSMDLQNELTVESDSLQIDFYDNGEVDGDSISVFFNDQLLGANLKLSTKAIHMSLKLDSTQEYNSLSMFANNLGAIPPNTALMIIYDGKQRYELRLTSNLEKNATIRIRKKK